jgi:uncharacterized protein YhaN
MRRLQSELFRLNVEENNYLETPVYQSPLETSEANDYIQKEKNKKSGNEKNNILEFDQVTQNKLIDLRNAKQNELNRIENDLQQLKQMVCAFTNSKIDISWEELIEKLSNNRKVLVDQYKEITAKILAQINVFKVLEEYKKIEEGRIAEGLSSSIFSKSLFATTSHYNHIEKEDGELFVRDQFGEYKIGELSTGAREQVLLGLRIGFASNLLAGEPLFLILDDAFQHSDWERRELLVEKMMDLAKAGWQIIYFSMDDHIKSLFENKVKPIFKEQYQLIQLEK